MHKVEIRQDPLSRGLWTRSTWMVGHLISLFEAHPIMKMILTHGRLQVKLFEGWASIGWVIGTSRITLMLNCDLVHSPKKIGLIHTLPVNEEAANDSNN